MTKQKVSRKKKTDPSKVKKKQTKAGQIIKQKVVINVDKALGARRRRKSRPISSKSAINKPQSIPTISRFDIPNFIFPSGPRNDTLYLPPPNDDIKRQLMLIQEGQTKIDKQNKQNLRMITQQQSRSMQDFASNINQQAKNVFQRLNKLEANKTIQPPEKAEILEFIDDAQEQIAEAIDDDGATESKENDDLVSVTSQPSLSSLSTPQGKVGKKSKLTPEERKAVAIKNLQKAHIARRGSSKKKN
jgi:hypothetical protein